MASEAQKRANRNYYQRNKDRFKMFLLRFDKEKDADIIRVLENTNKTEYVRELFRNNAGALK